MIGELLEISRQNDRLREENQGLRHELKMAHRYRELKAAAQTAYDALKLEELRCGRLFGEMAEAMKALEEVGVK